LLMSFVISCRAKTTSRLARSRPTFDGKHLSL
jgi:hypothetical protein